MPAASDRKSHLPLSMALSRGAGREQLNFHINRDTTTRVSRALAKHLFTKEVENRPESFLDLVEYPNS